MRVSACPACGAALPPGASQCPYCGGYLEGALSPPTPSPPAGEVANWPAAPGEPPAIPGGILLRRRTEPNESAFTLSVPDGWLLQGGIHRADLMHQVVDAQSIAAKVDFAVRRDAAATVQIRWCPEMRYCDLRATPAGAMGLFPPGSNYQGMLVSPALPAADFLVHTLFPWAHPNAAQVQIAARDDLPLLADAYRRRMRAFGLPVDFRYDAARVTFAYLEGGAPFEERAQVVIEDMGSLAGGMWSNKDAVLLRAPAGELARWEPLLQHIRESVRLDPLWLAREIVNQEFLTRSFFNAQQAERARSQRLLEVQQYIQQADRQMAEHRRQTHAEIQNDQYLALMNLEEYVNPYTHEVETGSDRWRHRWVTAGGDEFYTDDEYLDPNVPGALNRTDWQRTPVRPRFPGGA